jgi:hypothetical protein
MDAPYPKFLVLVITDNSLKYDCKTSPVLSEEQSFITIIFHSLIEHNSIRGGKTALSPELSLNAGIMIVSEFFKKSSYVSALNKRTHLLLIY